MLLVCDGELTEPSGGPEDSTFVERMAGCLIWLQEVEDQCCNSSGKLQLAVYFQVQESISMLPVAEVEVTKRDSEHRPRLDPKARLGNILTIPEGLLHPHSQEHVVPLRMASFELVLAIEVPTEDLAVVREDMELGHIALISGEEEAAQHVMDTDVWAELEGVVLELDLDLCSDYIVQLVSHVALVFEKRANPQRNQYWMASAVFGLQLQLEVARLIHLNLARHDLKSEECNLRSKKAAVVAAVTMAEQECSACYSASEAVAAFAVEREEKQIHDVQAVSSLQKCPREDRKVSCSLPWICQQNSEQN